MERTTTEEVELNLVDETTMNLYSSANWIDFQSLKTMMERRDELDTNHDFAREFQELNLHPDRPNQPMFPKVDVQ